MNLKKIDCDVSNTLRSYHYSELSGNSDLSGSEDKTARKNLQDIENKLKENGIKYRRLESKYRHEDSKTRKEKLEKIRNDSLKLMKKRDDAYFILYGRIYR